MINLRFFLSHWCIVYSMSCCSFIKALLNLISLSFPWSLSVPSVLCVYLAQTPIVANILNSNYCSSLLACPSFSLNLDTFQEMNHVLFILYPCAVCLVTQLCLTLCDAMDCSPPGSSVHGDSPGKNTGVDCHAFLQGIFPTQGSNPGLLCRWVLYKLSH